MPVTSSTVRRRQGEPLLVLRDGTSAVPNLHYTDREGRTVFVPLDDGPDQPPVLIDWPLYDELEDELAGFLDNLGGLRQALEPPASL